MATRVVFGLYGKELIFPCQWRKEILSFCTWVLVTRRVWSDGLTAEGIILKMEWEPSAFSHSSGRVSSIQDKHRKLMLGKWEPSASFTQFVKAKNLTLSIGKRSIVVVALGAKNDGRGVISKRYLVNRAYSSKDNSIGRWKKGVGIPFICSPNRIHG